MGKTQTKISLTLIVFAVVVISSTLIFYYKQPSFQTVENQEEVKIPTFNDHLIKERFAGIVASIDYSSSDLARQYRMQIEKQSKNGVNFAGKYIIVSWGCGPSCQSGAVVDATNGKVYSLPVLTITCGMDFRADSNLLIINSDQGCVKDFNLSPIKTKYYLWQSG